MTELANEALMSKLRKVLALKKGGSEGEAAAAAATLARLLQKHNLDIADLEIESPFEGLRHAHSRDVREEPVPVVQEKQRLPDVSNEEVEVAIAVDVGRADRPG